MKVGGLTAAADDFASYTAARLPIFMGAVLILSFLLLMVVFRSLLVPLKAVIMNLLSIGAAYGVVVAVFQWGWGASLIGVGREAPVEAWAPVFIFAIVFGLSMDYEVFLLSRIREEYDRTGDNATAVADGLALTARVITAAALIMFFVFGSFVLGPEVALKLMGLGLAVAVLIDATIVRMVLVPATMELLGDWNWWLPKWLDRILPPRAGRGRPHPRRGAGRARGGVGADVGLLGGRRELAVATQRDARPDQLDHPEGPRPGEEAVRAREHAAEREQQHELPSAPFQCVHHHHEGDRARRRRW